MGRPLHPLVDPPINPTPHFVEKTQFSQVTGTIGHLWRQPDSSYDIFEGTEQIQQLVISRAISGMRIE